MPDPFQIDWSYPARWSLRQIHWEEAARVDAAVQRFAATGEGHVERVRGAPTGLWLKLPPWVVRLSIDASSQTVVVWWVCRAWW